MSTKTGPKTGSIAHHKGGLDARPVAEVSKDGKRVRLRIGTIVTEWVPARNYTFTEATR